MLVCPFIAAKCIAVYPVGVISSRFTLLTANHLTISMCPAADDVCIGCHPFSSVDLNLFFHLWKHLFFAKNRLDSFSEHFYFTPREKARRVGEGGGGGVKRYSIDTYVFKLGSFSINFLTEVMFPDLAASCIDAAGAVTSSLPDIDPESECSAVCSDFFAASIPA